MSRHIWKGGLILSAAALIVKILSTIYRLPYQNLAGDVGFYVYQQVYPLYALAVVMGGFGFPLVLSKMLAREKALGNSRNMAVIFTTAFVSLAALGLLLFAVIFNAAPALAGLMGDRGLTPMIKIMAYIYLVMPLLALLRGYFQGSGWDMGPTALSQVTEQTIRVALILGLSIYLFNHSAGPYQFGAAAAFGSVVAPVGGVVLLSAIFFVRQRKRRPSSCGPAAGRRFFDRRIFKKLLLEGIAFTLTSLTLVCFQFADALTVLPALKSSGIETPRALKGVYDRGFPLIQMGMMLSVALASAAVPVLTEAAAQKSRLMFKKHSDFTLKITVVLSVGAAAGLAAIMPEANQMLFEDKEGTYALSVLACTIATISFAVTSATLLQTAGLIWRPVWFLLIAAGLKTGLNFILVPTWHLIGAALSTFAASIVLSILHYVLLHSKYKIRPLKKKEWGRLAVVGAVMIICVEVWRLLVIWILPDPLSRIGAAGTALSGTVLGAAVFIAGLLKTGLIGQEELRQLPLGNKLSRLVPDKYFAEGRVDNEKIDSGRRTRSR